MRISTTPFLLTCAVLLFSALDLFAVPNISIIKVRDACGGNANGSFVIRVNSATGTGNLTFQVFGSSAPLPTTVPMPALFPYDFPVTNVLGDQTYLVVVNQTGGTLGGFDNDFASIQDFTATYVATDNTNPGCAPSNGQIDVTISGNGQGAFQFSWTGPAGFTDPHTEDLSGLGGGDYTLTYTDSNVEGVTSCTLGPIHINDPAPPPFSIDPSTLSICAGDAFVVGITATSPAWTYQVLEGPTVLATQAGTGSSMNINVAALPGGPHTLRVRASQGACPQVFNIIPDLTVTVNPAPDYNSIPDLVPGGMCGNTAIGVNLTSLKKVTSVVATSFEMVSISSGTLIPVAGTPLTTPNSPFTSVTEIADDVWKNGSAVSQDVQYTIATFAGPCPGNVITIKVTINPQPDFNNFDNLAPGVCSRQAIGVTLDPQRKPSSMFAANYNITAIQPNGMTRTVGSALPLPHNNVTANEIVNDAWQNVTDLPVNVVYTIVPVGANNCQGDPFFVTVAVNPQPDYTNLTNAVGVCSGDLIGVADLSTLAKPNTVLATTYNVVVTPNGATIAGGTPMATPITATDLADDRWMNTTSAPVNVIYDIEPVAGGCAGIPFKVTIAINPEPAYSDGNPAAICSDAAVSVNLNSFANVGSSLATAYDILSIAAPSLTARPGNATALPNLPPTAISNDHWENLTATTQTATYTVVPKTNGCVGAQFIVTVTVTPEPNVKDYDSTPGGVCSDDLIGINLASLEEAGSVPATTYSIVIATTLTQSAGAATTTLISDDAWTNTTSGAVPVLYTITPFNGTCAGDPFQVNVLIVPRPSYANFSNVGSGGICAIPVGLDLSTLKNAGSPDATSFDISISAPGLNPVNGPHVSGPGQLNTAIADDIWSNTNAAASDVTYTIIPMNGTCAGTQFTVIIRIKPQPDYTAVTVPVCSSEIISFDLNTRRNVTSAFADLFDVSVPTPPAGLTNTSGAPAGGSTANPIVTDKWQNLTANPISIDYTITPSTAGCAGIPFIVTFTINPEPVYNNTTLPGICSDDALGFDLEDALATGSVSASTFTYTTLVPANLTPGAGTLPTGSGNASVLSAHKWRNLTNGSLPLEYTITPESALGCEGVPFKVTITINPQPDYSDLPVTSVCSGTAFGIDLGSLKKLTSVGATSFTIESITFNPLDLTQVVGSPITGGLLVNELALDSYTNLTNTSHDVTYVIRPVIGTCEGDPFNVNVTIQPQPDYNPYVNSETPGGICSRAAIGVDLSATEKGTSVNATTYTVSLNTSNGLVGTATTGPGLLVNAIANDQWTNLTSAPVDVVYNVVPRAGTCDGALFTVTVTINPEPVGADAPATICSNDNVNYDLQANITSLGNNLGGSTFSWIAAIDNTSVTGESLTSKNAPFINDVLINATSVDQFVEYTVTPSSSLTCVGQTFKITITVSPRPVVAIGPPKEICSGSSVSYEILLNPANTPAGTIFTWPSPGVGGATGTPPGGIAAGPAGTTHINDILTNTSSTPLTVNYLVTPSVGGCTGTPQNITFIVYQAVVVEAGPNETICTGAGSYALTGFSVTGAVTTGTWTIASEPVPGHGVIDSPAATLTATEPGDYVLLLTSDVPALPNVCGAAADIVTITIAPQPLILPGQKKTICGNEAIGYEILTNPGLPATTVFTWPDPNMPGAKPSPPGGVLLGTPGTKHLNDVLLNDTNANFDVHYFVTPSIGLCIGAPEEIIITVRPSPVVVADQTKTICSGDRVDYEILLNPANLPVDTKFSWPIPDGIGATSQDNVAADPAGKFHITDTLFNASGAAAPVIYKVVSQGVNGCYGVTREVKIIVNSGAIADAGPAQSICANGVLTLSDASIAGAADATWTIISGPPGGVITPQVVPAVPGTAMFQAAIAGDYTLQLTTGNPTTGTCGPVSDVVKVTVKAIGDPSCTGGSGSCFVNHTPPVTTSPDCFGGGTNGKIEFAITDPGTFEFAVTTDLVVEPAVYNSLGGSLVTVNGLTHSDYAIWLRPIGAAAGCATKVIASLSGIYPVSYSAITSDVICFSQATGILVTDVKGAPGLPFQYTLTNTTDGSVTSGAITSSQAAAYSIPVVSNGNYSLVLTQDQSAVVPACTSPIGGGATSLSINGPAASLDTLYVKKAISVPDLPSGSALVGVKPSGLEPYEVRLELTTPIFASQQYVSDWSLVALNPQNLKFETSYTNLYAGIYRLGLRDAGGCEKTYAISILVDTNVLIPNIFTPNGDGHNEVFYIRNLPSEAKLLITNRWGKEVFKTSSYQNDWNGGDTVDGLYFYTLSLGGQAYNGWVEILRGQ